MSLKPTHYQIIFGGQIRFAEVHFYFQLSLGGLPRTFALVALYTPPNDRLSKLSYGTLISCKFQGTESLRVIPVNTILSVVGMVLHPPSTGLDPIDATNTVFVVEKLGLDMTLLRGTDPTNYEDDL